MIKLDAKIKIIEHLTEKEKDLLRLILARGERLPAEYDETDFSGGVLIGLAIERKSILNGTMKAFAKRYTESALLPLSTLSTRTRRKKISGGRAAY